MLRPPRDKILDHSRSNGSSVGNPEHDHERLAPVSARAAVRRICYALSVLDSTWTGQCGTARDAGVCRS